MPIKITKMLYATCLRIFLHFHELISVLPLSSIKYISQKCMHQKKKWILEGLHFNGNNFLHDYFNILILILKMCSAKYLFPKYLCSVIGLGHPRDNF